MLFLVIGVLAGFILFKTQDHFNPKISAAASTSCSFKFLNPLRCDNGPDLNVKEYTALRNDLLAYVQDEEDQKKVTNVSVYFRDLANGQVMSINSQDSFSPASLLKVPLLITYYKKAEDDPSILSRRFTIQGKSDTLDQNIKPEKSVEIGKSYSVEDLLNYLIIQSDNIAWEALLSDLRQNYSEEDFVSTLSDLGIIDPRKTHDEQYITTQSYASIFRTLYNAAYLNPEMSEKALELLSQSNFKNGIVAGIPEGIKVAHKFGEQKNGNAQQLHDCGIVYFSKNPYLICVMTQGNDIQNLEPVIQVISKKVYKEVESRN